MWREPDEITKFLARVVILAGNSRTRADSFASSSDETQRLLAVLWEKVFPGSTLPAADYRPNL
jgi:hypothetical protein